ncbi:MAG TPA: FG-GAP-like repeat-containing protein, partial [Ignavibacteria bacterium]|nr:FG-GAP-like repeat-containing protein [Ignavibacteria bacterium]HMR41762.1 FG-GAP-like repeat-containing protein [Ignavibacteria bacterium]
MKYHNTLKHLIVYTLMFVGLTASSKANQKQTPYTQQTKTDSQPTGVTQDWLNSLTDESGKKIIQEEDPEGEAMQKKVFNGISAGSNFGISVSSAGDVNGDGYDDIIIGAYSYNSNTGRAYIYYGGLNFNNVADLTITGEATFNVFGGSVSSAGDVNGDGYSDVIIGAYGYSSSKGRAYIYFGGASMNNTADIILTGESANNYFGKSVSNAGDVNGDGYSDVIVGADLYNTNIGRSYIYFGGSSMNNSADIIMTGSAAFNHFGVSVSNAGDVNADGFSDVIIGENGYSTNTGRAYIFFGGISMDNTADVVLTGESTGNNFGVSVSLAGDVNGDGYADVICGAYGFNSSTGKAYIYYGGAIMNSGVDVAMTGESASNFFGNSVSSAGDLNGDGFSDVIISSFGYSGSTGKVYVYFGGAVMNNVSDVTMTGETTNSSFGISVASAGDVNGDGYPELIVGAYGYNSNTGRAYFYNYFLKNDISAEVIMTGESTSNYFGCSVSSAGDVNGDGFSDVIVGARGYSGVTGRAYIFYGGLSFDNIADVVITGEASSVLGVSVSSAGDVNGDGYSDVIVGAYFYNSSTGRAYIYYGGSPMNATADVIMNGEAVNNFFGEEVCSAGDFNADGYSDVIVGAGGYYSSDGKVYIYYGGENMNNIADRTFYGTVFSGERFGSAVSSAGDVNGDGYSDILVGAYIYNNYRGRATLYFGGSNEKLEFSGASVNDFYGISVSSAGDVNADGYSDIIIGAHQVDSGAGKAYIYLGSTFMNNVADLIITGQENYSLGRSVSLAGDINRDGYSDVFIGSYGIGRADIFFGGIIMDQIPDVTMRGESTSFDNFGESVSSAGDINGDGYSDFIIGAEGFNTSTGRSYIYTGSAISAEPILLSVKDVPYDQGGYVDLKWARSSYDVNGSTVISDYIVERSLPPSGGNFAWATVAVIPSIKNSFYSFLAPTPFDSGSNTSGTFFFRITARTYIPSPNWHSAILSGRSIDNIAPLMVSPFTSAIVINNIRLTWKRSTASDLLNYVLYRSTSPSIDPQTEPVFTTTVDSTYLDTAPLGGVYYYFIVAQDIHNNLSPVAAVLSPNTQKLFLFGAIQGLYNPVTDIEIPDTISVYLRNSSSPYAIIDSSKNLLLGPGTGQEFFFNNSQDGIPYYIVVKHRNALETWSADPVSFVNNDASIAYSVSSIYAYGNNEIQVDNSPYDVYAFYSGDVNQDLIIDLTDIVDILNDANIFTTGYVVTDVTG